MAYTKISLTNGVEVKTAPVGFSWTTFFFGGWPALIRQDWIWGFGLLIACVFTWGIAGIVASFFYNKVYIKGLFEKGYTLQATPGITDDQLKIYLGYVKLPGRDE
jgi:hypothetical protein